MAVQVLGVRLAEAISQGLTQKARVEAHTQRALEHVLDSTFRQRVSASVTTLEWQNAYEQWGRDGDQAALDNIQDDKACYLDRRELVHDAHRRYFLTLDYHPSTVT